MSVPSLMVRLVLLSRSRETRSTASVTYSLVAVSTN
jgi:hypothetical protein